MQGKGRVEHLDPDGTMQHCAFTNVVTVGGVLARSDCLVELEAVAVVPE